MGTKTKTRLHRGVNSKLNLHTAATKIRAVAKVNALMNAGMSQTKALAKVAGPLDVSSQSVQNWRTSGNYGTISNNHTTLVQPVGTLNHTDLRRFAIRNVGLRTVDGVNITLTLEDIQEIAHFAGYIS